MRFWTWHFKGEKKVTSIHLYMKRSIPETLFGTLTNLRDSVQKHFSIRTLIRQKLVKWFAMQNSWLVSKPTTFSVKGISKQIVTHFQPMFHLNKPGSLFLVKCVKKHLWKSDISSKDAGQWPVYLVKMILTKDTGIWHASLLKMPLYYRYFVAHFVCENQLTIWILYARNIGTLAGNRLKTDFKYIIHLLFIAQNSICIGFLCMSYMEKVTLQQCHSHLSIFYHFHLAWYILITWDTLPNINKCLQDHFFCTLLVKP